MRAEGHGSAVTVLAMTAAARPVARLSTPGEIVAMIPVLCGFVPQESLVVVSLRGPRKRVGLTMRFDLGWAAADPLAAADEVAERLALDAAAQLVLVVCTDQGEGLRWQGLVGDVRDACSARGIGVNEALLVRDGRWWSYLCSDERCCPASGTPVAAELTPALRLVEAERVLEGRAVLASRDELVRSVAAPVFLAARAAQEHLDRAAEGWLQRLQRDGAAATRARDLAAARDLVERVRDGAVVSGPEAAALAFAVRDVLVRDEVATWCLESHDALLSTLLQTARLVVGADAAPVLALLGWVAYAHGDGGLANVALDRCLRSDGAYTLGLLLLEMLSRQVPPTEVRTLLETTHGRRRD